MQNLEIVQEQFCLPKKEIVDADDKECWDFFSGFGLVWINLKSMLERVW